MALSSGSSSIEQILDLRARIRTIDSHLSHLARSQDELSEFLADSPEDADYIQAIEENDVIISKKDALLLKLIEELKMLDPTYEHVLESFRLQNSAETSGKGVSAKGNINDRSGNDSGGDDDADNGGGGDDESDGSDDGRYASVSEFVNRHRTRKESLTDTTTTTTTTTNGPTNAIDMQPITKTMASIFDEPDRLVSISSGCSNISSDNSKNNNSSGGNKGVEIDFNNIFSIISDNANSSKSHGKISNGDDGLYL